MWGNVFSGEKEFVGVGELSPGDTNWSPDVVVQWSSNTTMLLMIIFARMMEDGLVYTDELISKFIPEFNTTVKYIQSVKVKPDETDPNIVSDNPLTWKVTYGDLNLATQPLTILLNFNIGIPFSFWFLGAIGYGYFYDKSASSSRTTVMTKALSSDPDAIHAQAMMYQHVLFEKAIKEETIQDQIFQHAKNIPISGTKAILNFVAAAKKASTEPGFIPFAFQSTTTYKDLVPYYTPSPMSAYTASLDYLAICMDKIVKNAGYANLQTYARAKVITPMGMKNVQFRGIEPKLNAKYLMPWYNRASTFASYDSSGNLTPASYLCDPNYIKDKKVGQTVWITEYPNDGFANYLRMSAESYDPNEICSGISTVNCSIEDFAMISRFIIRKGIADNGTRILSREAVDWILAPKVIGSANTFQLYPVAQDNNNISWCGGTFKVNNDLCFASIPYITSSTYYSGGGFGTWSMFNTETGTYVLLVGGMFTGSYMKYNYRTIQNTLKVLQNTLKQ
jgi:hypothetical protein